MLTVLPDRQRAGEAFAAESARVAELVRSCGDLSTPVPGLRWNIGQLAAHVTSVYMMFAHTIRGGSWDGELERGFVDVMRGVDRRQPLPAVIAAANDYAVGHLLPRDPGAAADALAEQAAALTAAVDGAQDLTSQRSTPWYGADSTRTVGTLACLAVPESLVHGRDLAWAVHGDTRMSKRSAAAAVPTVMSAMLPTLLDTRRAGSLRAAFELRVRGADPFVLRVEQGRAECFAAGEQQVDCVVFLDPCAALLLGFGRRSFARTALTGGALAAGRQPWLGLRVPSLFAVP